MRTENGKTKIKLCGLTRPEDIQAANSLLPDYIGFVFATKSRRFVSPRQAADLKKQLLSDILAVGVFVDEEPDAVAALLTEGVIDLAQLHGGEDEPYIGRLRALTEKPLIQAFSVRGEADIRCACKSSADVVLLDAGAGGTGWAFDWTLLEGMERPYLLAGGLSPDTVGEAVRRLCPWGVDVSSGIETTGKKDAEKMRAFVEAVRLADLSDRS